MDELLTKRMGLELEGCRDRCLDSTTTKFFTDVSDADIQVMIRHGESGSDDYPVEIVKMLFRYGRFDLAVEHHSGGDGDDRPPFNKILLGITAGELADGEIDMLRDALRFVADNLGGSSDQQDIAPTEPEPDDVYR